MTARNDLTALADKRRAAVAARQGAITPTIEPPAPAQDARDTAPAPSATPAVGATYGTSITPMAVDLSRQLEQGDMLMPRLKISQAMSKAALDSLVPIGNWYHSTAAENLGPEILVVPVAMQKSRSLFVSGAGMLCRSFDMLHGEGEPGILCEGTPEERYSLPEAARGCPLRLWDRSTGSNIPPKCGIAFNYPVLLLDKDDPAEGRTRRAMLTFRGTSAQAAKTINTIVMEDDGEWHEHVIRLRLDRRTNTKGTFFVPVAERVGAPSPAVAQKAIRLAGTLQATSIRASVEADRDAE